MFDDEFFPPPEAPVFEPNEEEFAHPLGYIAKIRPIAEKAGICKIRPPPYWQPPFAIDVENFKFTPRIQRLNELGIQTRIRLQFIQKVAKFWELQGTTFRLPHIAGSPLDLYGLHETVRKLGGFEEVCKNRQWNAACVKLGVAKNFSATIKQHYERLLYPYDIMVSGVLLESLDGSGKPLPSFSGRYGGNSKVKPQREQEDESEAARQKNKRRTIDDPSLVVDVSNNKELAKLQLFGAGPKMVGLGLIAKRRNRIKSEEANKKEIKSEPAPATIKIEPKNEDCKNIFDLMDYNGEIETKIKPETAIPTATVDTTSINTRKKGSEQLPYSILDTMGNCKVCLKDHNDTQLLLCDGCDDSYHTYCLIPPLNQVPKGDWRCPKCLSKECNKVIDAYGFEQARKQYTLQSFGEMADAFKSEYFTKPVHMIPTELVEREFWRLIGSIEEDVAVEYGADIHVLNHGSGFPRMCDKEKHPLSAEEEDYAKSGWNLNNLPVAKQSLLSYMTGDMSGMKIPWVYVGMCFSAFCWHIEDHWTYSINYLHWGEPKTWYGVPREDAIKLEEVMQNTAPDLFKNHPDVMHHLVTTINPSTLMNNGVRVVRTNQCAGEFIVTFPRAYHAGFNQGYNFAEAVNFCPADWIPIGRQSVAHYRAVKRACVFSHEEILCKVANNPDVLDVQLAAAVYRDMLAMLQEEREARKKLHELGVCQAEREAFEVVPDDERQCFICKTACFLSAITCPCRPDHLVCTFHVNRLCSTCDPSKFILRYRYTLDELPPLLHKMKLRAESFDTWTTKLGDAFSRFENKYTLHELKELLEEAVQGKFPENDLLHQLQSAVREAEKCSRVAQQLVVVRKHRTRQKEIHSTAGIITHPNTCLLTLEEIRAFYLQLLGLPCTIPNLDQVSDYIKRIEKFVTQTEIILQEEEPCSHNIAVLIEDSLDFDLELPQVTLLHHALQQAKWLEEVRSCLLLDDEINDCDPPPSLITLEQLRKLIDSGVSVSPRPAVERAMAELQELLNLSEAWEDKAKSFLEMKEKGSLKTAEVITSESQNVPVQLIHCAELQEVVEKANIWEKKLHTIHNQDYYPYLEVLEALLLQANSMEVKLSQLPILNTQVEAAQEWKERTCRAFLKKNTIFSLFEVLSPRSAENRGQTNLKAMRRKIKDAQTEQQQMIEKWAKTDNFDIKNPIDPAEVVAKFKDMEEKELEVMKDMRSRNNRKSTITPTNIEVKSENDSYCVCKRPSSGFMLQCELCHDWFHTSCVPPIKFNKEKSKVQQVYELKFLCPLCHRSRRPRLEVILSLLLQLQKLPVRIREGEALQCLTERAMSWQDRARDILKAPEYAAIIKKLNKKMKENEKLWQEQEKKISTDVPKISLTNGHNSEIALSATARRMSSIESINDTIDSVLRKSCPQEETRTVDSSGVDALLSAASKTDTEQEDVMEAAEVLAMIACASNHHQSQVNAEVESTNPASKIENNPSHQPDTEVKAVITSTTDEPSIKDMDKVDDNHKKDNAIEQPIAVSDYEQTSKEEKSEQTPPHPVHSEDITSTKEDVASAEVVDEPSLEVKELRKETEEILKGPLIDLPDEMKTILEELMMEGDLLEVSLDETQQIWKILQASQPINDEKFLELCESEASQTILKSNGLDKEADRKRKKKEEVAITNFAEKRKKKQRNSTDGTPFSGKDNKKHEKKKKRKSEGKQSVLDTFVAFDDDEYAFCAVKEATGGSVFCQQPTGEEVDWLQCDGGCEGWFHCVCVSVSPEEARELDYVCEKCAAAKLANFELNLCEDMPSQIERQNSDCSSGMEVDVTNSTPSMSPAPVVSAPV
ncbi:lysine-specific demethylase 5A-like [Styela clava]